MASLLILTEPINRIIPSLPKVLKAASSHVKDRLFIHLDVLSLSKTSKEYSSLWHRSHVISSIYSMSPVLCPGVDVCVLMSGFKEKDASLVGKINFENVFIDHNSTSSEFSILKERYNNVIKSEGLSMLLCKQLEVAYIEQEPCSPNIYEECKYDNVGTGGTFDGIHSGHKILLSEAALRCRNLLTVGVANGPFLTNKVLKELIRPLSRRREQLLNFLLTIDSSLKYNILEMTDPLGPTKYDQNLEMIVLSDESKNHMKRINEYRRKHGLSELKNHSIKIFEDPGKQYKEEREKFSSTSYRMRLLGKRLKEVTANLNIPSTPYIIGLTGGSASGKTSIGKKLKELGASVIECDKLLHEAYEYNSECYHKIVNEFDQSILNEDKSINRKTLESIVFGKYDKLKQLADIVWPKIASLIKSQIEAKKTEGKKVIVLDASVLLEANWNVFCHEVWVSIIDRDEAVRRIVERDSLSLKAAQNRIDSQLNNQKRLAKANIVFSTLFSYEYTHQQVEKAWKILDNEGKLLKENL